MAKLGAHLRYALLRHLCVISLAALFACAPIEQHSSVRQPIGTKLVAGIGDTVLRVVKTEDLPNIFGRADLYGRTRDRGFTEIQYMGVDQMGYPVFRRRNVDIITNETTMTQSGLGTAIVTAQPAGSGFVATGVTTRAPNPYVQPLPPDTIEFVLDLSKSHEFPVEGKIIKVLEADPTALHYVIQ